MPYATAQDMLERFGETELVALTDRTDASFLNVDVLQRALEDADAQINAYLDGRYTLPLVNVPGILRRYAADIARYLLHDDRVTDQVRQRYEDAVAFLRLVADGKVQLGFDPDNAQAAASGSGADYVTPGRMFTLDSLKGFGS